MVHIPSTEIMAFSIGLMRVRKGVGMKFFTKEWYVLHKKEKADTRRIENMYVQYLSSVASVLPEDILRDIHLHDAVLLEKYRSLDNLVMKFDVSHALSYVKELLFIDAEIVSCDDIKKGDYWLFEEMYLINGKYEINILFCDQDDNPKQIVVCMKDVVFKYDEAKKASINQVKKLLKEYQNASVQEKISLLKQIKEIQNSNLQL